MVHYKSAQTENGFVAILHNTAVLEKTQNRLIFKTGGFQTRSTAKAINQGLDELGVKDYRARIFKGTLQILYKDFVFPCPNKFIVESPNDL